MHDPNKIIKQAVKDAQATLAQHVDPVEGKADDCQETVSKLLDTLDDTDVVQAVNESDLMDRPEDAAWPTDLRERKHRMANEVGDDAREGAVKDRFHLILNTEERSLEKAG